MKHSFFGGMGGYVLEYQNEGRIIIRPAEIRWLASENLPVFPEIECSEIDGVSRMDIFQKVIATTQLIWFALQFIGRAIKGMEFALPEVTTLGFITYAIVILFFWWKKPSGVSTRTKIRCPSISDQDIDRVLVVTKGKKQSQKLELHLPQTDFGDDGLSCFLLWLSLCLIASVGGWHLAAWNYSLPTTVGSILWRVSSVSVGVVVIALCFPSFWNEPESWLSDWTLNLLILAYVIARMFLIVETVISLRSAPAGIYERVRWSDFVPHV
ncbi:uncharacterized protein A1O5_03566 [Cladophialophora psammophila CBS 110553]|uniref:Uncharacterized protein n=1 Tax=Cladophialophora psammophila CBS 110553 TaxID=1182543 RepID=W9XU46_9EURO|nr:uncharacterized protein A1O5_03566 [Cladophialophora psammophila CBS 110553]EXJ73804.1 hypothetical protein A1O5_03566 [Cladophialophora psammophila CBS 110553]